MDIECSWNNNEGRDLVFGFEMCVVFGQFVDDKGVWQSVVGQRHVGTVLAQLPFDEQPRPRHRQLTFDQAGNFDQVCFVQRCT